MQRIAGKKEERPFLFLPFGLANYSAIQSKDRKIFGS
jgi:hypothetical protein